MLVKDAEGFYPIRESEYLQLKNILVICSKMEQDGGALKERLKTIKNGWRDFRMLQTRMEDLAVSLCATVPTKKLLSLQKELKNSKVAIVPTWSKTPIESVVQVDEKSFISLLNLLVERDCFMCSKKTKEAKKCPIRQAYLNVLKYEMDTSDDGYCEMAGRTGVGIEED